MNRKIINCSCSDIDHSVVISCEQTLEEVKKEIENNDVWFMENESGINIYVQLIQYRSLFQRIWTAIKYIFNIESKFGHWSVCCLTYDDLDILYDYIEYAKERKKITDEYYKKE